MHEALRVEHSSGHSHHDDGHGGHGGHGSHNGSDGRCAPITTSIKMPMTMVHHHGLSFLPHLRVAVERRYERENRASSSVWVLGFSRLFVTQLLVFVDSIRIAGFSDASDISQQLAALASDLRGFYQPNMGVK
ncbi:hypothetical protein E4U55_004486 [Claviceps digitariae]|nr:hypothetical protein E4U55_004486 [Claviceps digitariae]